METKRQEIRDNIAAESRETGEEIVDVLGGLMKGFWQATPKWAKGMIAAFILFIVTVFGTAIFFTVAAINAAS